MNRKGKDKEELIKLGEKTQFGKGNDPSKAGKKGGKSKNLVTYMREELGIELGQKFSKESVLESLQLLMTTSMSRLKELHRDDSLPAHLSIYISALIKDREQGRFSTASELFDRVHGKAKEEVKLVSNMTTEELLEKNKETEEHFANIRNIKRD